MRASHRNRSCLGAAAFGAALLLIAGTQPSFCQQPQTPEGKPAYKDARKHRRGYFGAGREEPEPQELNAVLLGYFGPDDPDHPEGGAIWQATNLAVEEANAEGGYKGLPFRLVQAWAENPWADGSSKVVRLVYLERVWALIGSIDGAATHVAEQVVAKARVPLIDPASTDDSVNQANVVWMFSCLPSDPAIAEVIVQSLRQNAARSFVLLSATDHDSRALTGEFKAALSRARMTPLRHIEFASGAEQLEAVTAQAAASSARAVVLFARPKDSARAVRQIRRRSKELLIYGGPSMGRQAFFDAAGAFAEAIRVPVLVEPSDTAAQFIQKWTTRHGSPPDYAAMQAYDAVKLLIAAIRKAGLNRVRILDALEALSPWQGVSGAIRWDELGRNARPARMGVIRNGRPEPLDTPAI